MCNNEDNDQWLEKQFILVENLEEKVDPNQNEEILGKKLIGAMAKAFSVDPMLVASASNYDLFEYKKPIHKNMILNYAQWVSRNERSITVLLAFLFDKKEPFYGEPWQHDQKTKERLHHFYTTIATSLHPSIEEYLDACSSRLGLYGKHSLKETESWCLTYGQKMLANV